MRYLLGALLAPALTLAALDGATAVGPDTKNTFALTLRSRVPSAVEKGAYEVVTKQVTWDPKQTAVIVCDMWDSHHSLNAVRRVQEIAPRMNRVLEKARSMGALIIHAPSSCMAPYKDHPARKRAQAAPKAANLPAGIAAWCHKIPAEEQGIYPLDQTDGGCDTDPAEQKEWQAKLKAMGRNPAAPWLAQIDVLKIHDEDAISDSGVEIWSLLEQRGIKNVILVGVHTNMCVLGRPFGLRQLSKNGKNVVLMRDMTDTMYNPARWPYVAHFHGTDLIVAHIEKFVCPTVTSDQLLGGQAFRFQGDVRRRAVVLTAETLYDTKTTLPRFAKRVLEGEIGLETTVIRGEKDSRELPGLVEALAKADLLVMCVRRRALPEKEMAALKKYLDSGKPLLALRTSSHAFDVKGKAAEGLVEWPKFDPEVLGGHYDNHYPEGPVVTVTAAPGAAKQPLLTEVKLPFTSKGALYKTSPLAPTATPLLVGAIKDYSQEPVAWTNAYKKARVFYTSLGHPDDFGNPAFVRLLHNAARWALDMPIRPPPERTEKNRP
jgi:nicotinamidase-related amidase/type 1 glutamine amidotransferase